MTVRDQVRVTSLIAVLVGVIALFSKSIPLFLLSYPVYPIGLLFAGLVKRYKGNHEDGATLLRASYLAFLLPMLVGIGICSLFSLTP